MPRILALDTATEACSVALVDGSRRFSRSLFAPREHAARVLDMVAEVLAESGLALADMDALAFGRGPGGFTGVRIATSVVQGLAYAANKPVVPVSTLRALAQGLAREQGVRAVLAAIDARMGEVYAARFAQDENGLMQAVDAERVCPPEAVRADDAIGLWGTGSGWSEYGERLRAGCPGIRVEEGMRFPQALDIAILAEADFQGGMAVSPELALPVYLRDQVAEKPRPRA